MIHVVEENFDGNPAMFETLLSDSEKPLYNGGGWSDASFTLLLEAVKDSFQDNVLPGCTYEATKILSTMGLRYEKIHACPNDCILYLNEFRRMFSNPGDAEKLTWHHNGRTMDWLMRHPTDSPQWRFIDETFPDLRKMNVTYALHYLRMPGNDIDIYLQPLIDDLKILWERVLRLSSIWKSFGVYREREAPCPLCEDGFKGIRLKASKKNVFFGHRPFLPFDHIYRWRKKAFDGKQMFERRPNKVLTSEDVFAKIKDMQITFGKGNKKELPTQGYKKCSNLWSLPYWRLLFVRHSLHIMHIEKNVCDSLIGTLLNIPGKTKDDPNARDDLKEMNIRTELHPILKGSRNFLPPAAYTLSRKEKIQFCECLAGVKVPQGYSSNFSSLVSMQNLKLMGLKSHDCHVLMQQLLPFVIRGIVPKNVRVVITRLCSFFNAIYSKVIDPNDLDDLESQIVVILCQLEMYFPPSFLMS
ncbi:uncharacterized protein LOC130590170 [Beta vulgaris subsp. vulgaris]|uniref:uncharacterized protein LOC130590170 n=1 Tax=Beta vulgaris subsp. vulgaris TaxID=3555 RepID=UPI00254972A2|nr:uncharacterized protein LOC130590170 [Beta vulgaris subsp. vulgaris]